MKARKFEIIGGKCVRRRNASPNEVAARIRRHNPEAEFAASSVVPPKPREAVCVIAAEVISVPAAPKPTSARPTTAAEAAEFRTAISGAGRVRGDAQKGIPSNLLARMRPRHRKWC